MNQRGRRVPPANIPACRWGAAPSALSSASMIEPDRHARQVRLPQIGAEGQRALAAGRVAIVGVGANGSHLAETLGRAGVGSLRLIDRDVVELSNLQRQALYTTEDVAASRPKAEAAARALSAIDPGLAIEPVVADLLADRADELLGGVDLVLDGTDNFPTRFVVNDWCVRAGVPWIYAGAVGVEGQTFTVVPGGPCLRCYVPEPPPPGSLPTCDTAGVLGPAINLVTALAATEALRWIVDDGDARVAREATVRVVDAWAGTVRGMTLARDPACPCCGARAFPFLDDAPAATAAELCGREAVQLPAPPGAPIALDFDALEPRVAGLGDVQRSAFLMRVDLPERRVLVFRDGRLIVGDTTDPSVARTVRAKLLGE